MDIQALRYLVTLSEIENVRRASALLKITPPALSKAIRQLELELGYPLTVRTGRNIVLTDRAKSLSTRARHLISDFDQLRSEEESAAPEKEKIRIATFEVFSTYFLQTFEDFDRNSQLILHEAGPGGIERAILDGEADYGITYLPVATAGLEFDKILSTEMGVYTRGKAFPGVKQPDLPFVAPVHPLYGTPSRVKGLDGWPENAYPRKIRYQVTLLESALELVRNGWCAGYFPVFIAEAHNRRMKAEYQFERRPSPYAGRKCYTDIYLIRRKSDPEGKVYKKLAKSIRMFCKN